MMQLITPTPDIPCQPGWCLRYVRQTFGLPARYASATEAWENSASQHPDRDFPSGVWVPVWYGIDREPLGHVVLLAPDGSVYSTSDNSTIPHHHPSLADLEDFYAGWGWPLTYRGWTEDVAGYPVIGSSTINFDSGPITPTTQEEDTLSAAEVKELKDFIFTTVGTLFEQYHGVTRFHVVSELSKKIEDSEYEVKVFAQTVDNENADRVIMDNRAQEEMTRNG
jgi:hypothetical protein